MKKILLAGFAFVCMSSAIHAQTYKPFRVDLMMGYAMPAGAGAKGGVAMSVEPKYAVLNQVSVGLRIEGAITARGWVSSDGTTMSAKVAASGSYLATGDYYFLNTSFRPFAGIGTGIYSIASASVDETSQNNTVAVAGGTKFGGMARAGFEINHFRVSFEYNLIGRSTQTVADGTGTNVSTVSSKNSYTAIKLGFFIGGGRQLKTIDAKY